MKNINKKGFVLAESIVVGVFIIGLLTFLILNILPLIGDYERIDKYDNLDKKYNTHLIRKMILLEQDSARISDILAIGYNGYSSYPVVADFCVKFNNPEFKFNNQEYCNTLLSSDYLNVKSVIVSSYETTNLKSHSNEFSRAIKEYIDYIPSNKQMVSLYEKYQNYRRIIIEYNDGTFSNIEVKYENS